MRSGSRRRRRSPPDSPAEDLAKGPVSRIASAAASAPSGVVKIESRPIEGRPWEYAFYVDVEGKATDEPLAGALDNLRGVAELVKVLGSYPTRW